MYLSNTVNGAWTENNDPKLFIQVTRLTNTLPLLVLDLNIDFDWVRFREILDNEDVLVAEEKAELTRKLLKYARIFPFLVARGCKARRPKGIEEKQHIFKYEYIFPQLLLEVLSDEKTPIGIRYRSTKNPEGVNFVFPTVSKYKKSGYCDELSIRFRLTDPISSGDLSINPETKLNELQQKLQREKVGYLSDEVVTPVRA